MGGLFGLIGPYTVGIGRRNPMRPCRTVTADQRRVLTGVAHFRGDRRPLDVHRMVRNGRIIFDGQQHLRGLDGGAILIGAHIGNWELGPYAALECGHKVAAIYRPLNNQLLAGLLERRQANYGGDIFRKGARRRWHGQRPSQGGDVPPC